MTSQDDVFFITGATGHVGSEVFDRLSRAGKKVICASRSPSSQPKESPNFRSFDFTRPETWESALEGVSKVFLVRPPHISNIPRDMVPFLRFLVTKNLKQVVFLSVQGAESNPLIPHNKIEKALKALGLPATFLRPSFFMQNLTSNHREEIQHQSRFVAPTGRGRTNYVDVRDLGDFAFHILTTPGQEDKAYTVTGTRSFSSQEICEALTAGLGRRITHGDFGPFRFLSHRLKQGNSLSMSLVMLALYTVVKTGKGDITTPTFQEVMGRPPRPLEVFIQDHAECWSPAHE